METTAQKHQRWRDVGVHGKPVPVNRHSQAWTVGVTRRTSLLMSEDRLPIDELAHIAGMSHQKVRRANIDGQTVDHSSQQARTGNDGMGT